MSVSATPPASPTRQGESKQEGSGPEATEPTPSESLESGRTHVELSQWRDRHRSDPGLQRSNSDTDGHLWSWPLFRRRSDDQRAAERPAPPQHDPTGDERGTPLLPPLEVRQVRLVQADSEWGGGLGISSSSSSDGSWDLQRRRRWEQLEGSSRHEVRVVEVATEWKGLGFGDTGSSSSSWAGRQPPRLRATSSAGSVAGSVDTRAGQPELPVAVARQPICPQHLVFVLLSLLHTADFGLRTASICVYKDPTLAFGVLLPLQVFGTFLNIYSTFHDADVLLWLHKQPTGMSRFLAACAAFVVFGCFQVITVKRAWARQLQVAEVLQEMGVAGDYDDRATTAGTLPVTGSERMLPVALITGVPFLVVNWLWNEQCRLDDNGLQFEDNEWVAVYVIWAANLVLIATVSLGLIEIDLAISSYIFKRYHYEPERHFRVKKSLFPLVHIAFRASEVFLRLVVITGFVVGIKRKSSGLMFFPLLLDYSVGVALLIHYSPTKESVLVHFIAAVGLMLADVGHFVDLPNFAAPARCITSNLTRIRLLCFGFLACLDLLMEHFNVRWFIHPYGRDAPCQYFTMFGSKAVLIAGGVYYLLRLSPQIRCLGDDLHTAARAGDAGRIRTLLRPDQNGQVLDVNAEAKDRKGMTPLMLAAQGGHVEVIQELLNVGAQINGPTDIDGNTCLHHAAMNRQLDACRVLVGAGADVQVRNSSGASPSYLVPRRSAGRADPVYDDLSRILAPDEEDTGSTAVPTNGSFIARTSSNDAHRRSSHSTNGGNRRYTVNVAPTAGLQLRTLFPDVETDDTPSPRVLQSVSALVVSRAAGSLARRVLARQDERNTRVPLGALRRVRELGRGGFGRVIEVELPAPQRSSSLWLRASEPRRFALKLQLKQHQCQATSEVLALRRADHPFIVHLERAFSFNRFFALLLELCPTDLNRLLCELDESGRALGLRPSLAAKYMGQAGLALAHLHRNEKIVFRDVKPENILISARDEAKLTDFGLAKVVTSAERMTMCGTMGFLPPELLNDQGSFHNSAQGEGDPSAASSATSDRRGSAGGQARFNPFKCDAYSFGVTLQVTLLGEDGARRRTVHRKGPMMLPLHLSESENTELLMRLRETGRLSSEAHALLVERLLPHNPAKRSCLTDSEVLNHPFFLEELGCEDLAGHLLPPGMSFMK